MSERLGLFTIIVFGEVMAGVINGVSAFQDLSFRVWLNFSLAVFIVFALWWIFFTLVSDRKCKPGLSNSSFLELLYVPTLIGLGLTGMSFSRLFESYGVSASQILSPKEVLGFSLGLFLLGINLMTILLEYSPKYYSLRKRAQLILYSALILVLIITLLDFKVSLPLYLTLILFITLLVIVALNYSWYSKYPGDQVTAEE